ncbi:MAG: class I SAM-dependent methyltransferase [Deltaproteobacteria bacterium]|nr:class I SAM-dependent methyltransferase [Deltaproteobacteria bacterium]
MLSKHYAYLMPKMLQKDYWEEQWYSRNLMKQIANAKKKAWWPILERMTNNIANNEIILEAGCGMGQFVYVLDEMGKKIIGIDIAEKAILNCKDLYPKLNFIISDINEIPLPNNCVKLLISLGVIEHFEEGPDKSLKEANRVLKHGGTLFLTFPYYNIVRRIKSPIRRYKNRSKSKDDYVFYQYAFSLNHIAKMLDEIGLDVQSSFPHHSHIFLKDEIPLFKYLKNPFRKQSDSATYKLWGKRIDKISKHICSHMLLVTAKKR